MRRQLATREQETIIMQSAAPATKQATKQTIRIFYHKDTYSVKSPKMKFLGDEWYFNVENRQHTHCTKDLLVRIRRSCVLETLPGSVNYEIRLVGADNQCISQSGEISKETASGGPVIHYQKVLDYLNAQGFFNARHNMRIELELTVKEQAEELGTKNCRFFWESSPFPADCVLLVQEEKVYVDRNFLSMHSAFFKAMFESGFREKEQPEIELKDVDYIEFIELLSVVYPVGQFISVSNVECSLELADRFQMFAVLRQCEQFLILESNITNLKKLVLAQRYRLLDLQEHCASQYELLEEVKKLDDGPVYAFLNERMKSIMLDSLVLAMGK